MRLISIVAVCLLGFCADALAERVQIPGPGGVMLQADLFRPDAPKPVPAIVALHGCGGPFPSRDKQWREILLAAGHVVVFPDSFASRGLKSQCGVRNRIATAGGLRRLDALAAAGWLAAQSGVPAGGVVVMGWSDGGSTVLAAGEARADVPAGLIRGLIAFYPGCGAASRKAGWQPVAKLAILIGADDDWTPAAPCRTLAGHVGAALSLTSYPGAYHDFDAPVPVRIRPNVAYSASPDHSVHVGGNPVAALDAFSRVAEFLAGL